MRKLISFSLALLLMISLVQFTEAEAVWSYENGKLKYENFTFEIPSVFDVLYEELSNDTEVGFYPSAENSYATLFFTTGTEGSVSSQNQLLDSKEYIGKSIEESAEGSLKFKETYVDSNDPLPSLRYVFSMMQGAQEVGTVYLAVLFNEQHSNYLAIHLAVDAEDQSWYDYKRMLDTIIVSAVYSNGASTEIKKSSIPILPSIQIPESSADSSTEIKVLLSTGREVTVRKTVKEALDAYENFMDGYMDAMNLLAKNDFSGYMKWMSDYADYEEKINQMEDDLTDDESLYYLDVATRVLQKTSTYIGE